VFWRVRVDVNGSTMSAARWSGVSSAERIDLKKFEGEGAEFGGPTL
jgi:hypothetical protein